MIGHQTLAKEIDPIDIALGEHVSNRVMFKNFMQARAVTYVQVDCTRVGGISEFITVSLLARKFGLTVVPHVGDMGQIHQHLVLFNHISMGHDALFFSNTYPIFVNTFCILHWWRMEYIKRLKNLALARISYEDRFEARHSILFASQRCLECSIVVERSPATINVSELALGIFAKYSI